MAENGTNNQNTQTVTASSATPARPVPTSYSTIYTDKINGKGESQITHSRNGSFSPELLIGQNRSIPVDTVNIIQRETGAFAGKTVIQITGTSATGTALEDAKLHINKVSGGKIIAQTSATYSGAQPTLSLIVDGNLSDLQNNSILKNFLPKDAGSNQTPTVKPVIAQAEPTPIAEGLPEPKQPEIIRRSVAFEKDIDNTNLTRGDGKEVRNTNITIKEKLSQYNPDGSIRAQGDVRIEYGKLEQPAIAGLNDALKNAGIKNPVKIESGGKQIGVIIRDGDLDHPAVKTALDKILTTSARAEVLAHTSPELATLPEQALKVSRGDNNSKVIHTDGLTPAQSAAIINEARSSGLQVKSAQHYGDALIVSMPEKSTQVHLDALNKFETNMQNPASRVITTAIPEPTSTVSPRNDGPNRRHYQMDATSELGFAPSSAEQAASEARVAAAAARAREQQEVTEKIAEDTLAKPVTTNPEIGKMHDYGAVSRDTQKFGVDNLRASDSGAASQYVINSDRGSPWINFSNNSTQQEAPSGWKFHVSLGSENMGASYETVSRFLMDRGVQNFKIAGEHAVAKLQDPNFEQAGKTVTIYDNGEDWNKILPELEAHLKESGIKPSHEVAGDKPIRGSEYIHYRNDGTGESKEGYLRAGDSGGEHNPRGYYDPFKSIDVSPAAAERIRLEAQERETQAIERQERNTRLDNLFEEASKPKEIPDAYNDRPTDVIAQAMPNSSRSEDLARTQAEENRNSIQNEQARTEPKPAPDGTNNQELVKTAYDELTTRGYNTSGKELITTEFNGKLRLAGDPQVISMMSELSGERLNGIELSQGKYGYHQVQIETGTDATNTLENLVRATQQHPSFVIDTPKKSVAFDVNKPPLIIHENAVYPVLNSDGSIKWKNGVREATNAISEPALATFNQSDLASPEAFKARAQTYLDNTARIDKLAVEEANFYERNSDLKPEGYNREAYLKSSRENITAKLQDMVNSPENYRETAKQTPVPEIKYNTDVVETRIKSEFDGRDGATLRAGLGERPIVIGENVLDYAQGTSGNDRVVVNPQSSFRDANGNHGFQSFGPDGILRHELNHQVDLALAPDGYSHFSDHPSFQQAVARDLDTVGNTPQRELARRDIMHYEPEKRAGEMIPYLKERENLLVRAGHSPEGAREILTKDFPETMKHMEVYNAAADHLGKTGSAHPAELIKGNDGELLPFDPSRTPLASITDIPANTENARMSNEASRSTNADIPSTQTSPKASGLGETIKRGLNADVSGGASLGMSAYGMYNRIKSESTQQKLEAGGDAAFWTKAAFTADGAAIGVDLAQVSSQAIRASSAASHMAGGIGKLAKAAGPAGMLLSVGAGVADFQSAVAVEDYESAIRATGRTVGGVAGGAIGGIGMGALGSVVPVAGTTAGATVGAIGGGLGGAKIGEEIAVFADKTLSSTGGARATLQSLVDASEKYVHAKLDNIEKDHPDFLSKSESMHAKYSESSGKYLEAKELYLAATLDLSTTPEQRAEAKSGYDTALQDFRQSCHEVRELPKLFNPESPDATMYFKQHKQLNNIQDDTKELIGRVSFLETHGDAEYESQKADNLTKLSSAYNRIEEIKSIDKINGETVSLSDRAQSQAEQEASEIAKLSEMRDSGELQQKMEKAAEQQAAREAQHREINDTLRAFNLDAKDATIIPNENPTEPSLIISNKPLVGQSNPPTYDWPIAPVSNPSQETNIQPTQVTEQSAPTQPASNVTNAEQAQTMLTADPLEKARQEALSETNKLKTSTDFVENEKTTPDNVMVNASPQQEQVGRA